MKSVILGLVRLYIGVSKYEKFKFKGMGNRSAYFYCTDKGVMENYFGIIRPADISLNDLLNGEIETI